jgi:hypothetical protein
MESALTARLTNCAVSWGIDRGQDESPACHVSHLSSTRFSIQALPHLPTARYLRAPQGLFEKTVSLQSLDRVKVTRCPIG